MNIIRELRKKKGIQQKELALEIGVSIPTVSEWETGKKDPSGERLRKLAKYFGVDELVILGKEVITIGGSADTPKTPEAIILAKGIDRMPEKQRKAIIDLMNGLYPGIFEKGSDEHET